MTCIIILTLILNVCTIEPNKENYICTNESKLIYWRETFTPLKRYKVGFVCNGLLSSFIDKHIPLKEFSKLCDLDIDLICIHKQSDIVEKIENINLKLK